MLKQKFVEPYPRDGKFDRDPSTELDQMMLESRLYADDFGHMLHDHLERPDADVEIRETFSAEYRAWANNGLLNLDAYLKDNPDSDEAKLRASSEFHFHNLSSAMFGMWYPIAHPNLFGDESLYSHGIYIMQDRLALHGLSSYANRQRIAGQDADYFYFSEENSGFRKVFEGSVNLDDAGIVLLEIARRQYLARRHPNIAVVPAPPQFSILNGSRNGYNRNANYVVVSSNGRAVGVQVQSTITAKDRDAYDPDRLVLVDCGIDFGNTIATRTSTRSSDRRNRTWAGIISAQRIRNMRINGQKTRQLRAIGIRPEQAVRLKGVASSLLDGIKPGTNAAVEKVESRILELL